MKLQLNSSMAFLLVANFILCQDNFSWQKSMEEFIDEGKTNALSTCFFQFFAIIDKSHERPIQALLSDKRDYNSQHAMRRGDLYKFINNFADFTDYLLGRREPHKMLFKMLFWRFSEANEPNFMPKNRWLANAERMDRRIARECQQQFYVAEGLDLMTLPRPVDHEPEELAEYGKNLAQKWATKKAFSGEELAQEEYHFFELLIKCICHQMYGNGSGKTD